MRLLTRSDFDGLACAMMLRELDMIDEIKFVHPKDVQDGKVELTENDVTANLPYDPRVAIAFDHHESEIDRLKAQEVGGKLIIGPNARSAARVVYDYYGGKEAFPRISDELMTAVDKGSNVDIGELCLRYGGGGHRNAGTCQLENDAVDAELPNIIAALNA